MTESNEKDLEEVKGFLDDIEVVNMEQVIEDTNQKTDDNLASLPYAVSKNVQLTKVQKGHRAINLEKTMKEKFNTPISKWKRFLHPAIREKFLEYVRSKGSLAGALVSLRKNDHFDISSSAVKLMMARFQTFAMMFEEAVDEYKFSLEDEATRRGVHGIDDAVYHDGKICGIRKKYSDSLLAKLLEANIDKYKKSGAGGTNIKAHGPIQVNINKHFGE